MHRRWTGAIPALLLTAAACGGGADATTTSTEAAASPTTTEATTTSTEATTLPTTTEATTTSTEATAAPTTTEAPAEEPTETPPAGPPPELPNTPVSAPLGEDATQSYNTGPNPFDPADLGFDMGEVIAKWYKAEGHWVVAFEGLDLSATGPVCPGASTFTDEGFVFVSNAPSQGADCSSFPTLSDDPDVRALECNGLLSYRTAIPADAAGNFLLGTIEKPTDDGFIVGMTSLSLVDPAAPEIDLATLSC